MCELLVLSVSDRFHRPQPEVRVVCIVRPGPFGGPRKGGNVRWLRRTVNVSSVQLLDSYCMSIELLDLYLII